MFINIIILLSYIHATVLHTISNSFTLFYSTSLMCTNNYNNNNKNTNNNNNNNNNNNDN